MPFVKLDCGILDSSLWVDKGAREVFLTALLMAEPFEVTEALPELKTRELDRTGFDVPPGWYGFVKAAGIAIVRRAIVDGDEEAGMAALERLASPDPNSRSEEYGGRRLVRVNGGFVILNFDRYRQKDQTAAERTRRYRLRQKQANEVNIHIDAPAETEPEEKPESKPKPGKYDPLDEPIPLLLATPLFKAVWIEFVNWRKGPRKVPFVSPHGPQAAFRHLEPLGPERAALALKICMEKGWVGPEYGASELLKREAGPVVSRGTSNGQDRPGIVKGDRQFEVARQKVIENAYAAWSDRRITEANRETIVNQANAATSIAELQAIQWPSA